MDTYFVILEFHLQAGFEDAALIVEEADTVGHFRPWRTYTPNHILIKITSVH